MIPKRAGITLALLFCLCHAPRAAAQTFDTVGTRAAGMGGAFTAVADDASAAYWNPAGFAAGRFFTMVVDRTVSKVNPPAPDGARSSSGFLLAIGMPALGLSYYRTRNTDLTPLATAAADGRNPGGAGEARLDTLITHHTGATLVQSVRNGIAVGATLKIVRGVASSTLVADVARDALLGDASELAGRGSSRFDADVGVMASNGWVKAGVTVRNLTEPEFRTADPGSSLRLHRQARAGVAVVPVDGWIAALDLDLTRSAGPLGNARYMAAGSEGQLSRRAFVRGGVRVNTAAAGQSSISAGGSYVVTGAILVDAQITGGPARGPRGWGVSARFVY